MVSRRGRITRFVATVLAIALSTQIACAQAADCMKMSASQGSTGHSETSHQMGGDGANADAGAPLTQVPNDGQCSQTTLCVNLPALPIVTLRAVAVAHVAQPISFGPIALEVRAVRPASPPPKT